MYIGVYRCWPSTGCCQSHKHWEECCVYIQNNFLLVAQSLSAIGFAAFLVDSGGQRGFELLKSPQGTQRLQSSLVMTNDSGRRSSGSESRIKEYDIPVYNIPLRLTSMICFLNLAILQLVPRGGVP